MGNWIANAFVDLFALNKEARMLMLGLDSAGKTSILFQMKLGESVSAPPTIGFNVERVSVENLTFTIWDVGGQDKIRRLWKYYYAGTDALIFVVDSSDRDRISEAAEELQYLLRAEELSDAILLVFANKQDMPHALTVPEIVTELGLHDIRNRQWHVQGSCAKTGSGLPEGLEWLSKTVATHSASPHASAGFISTGY